MPDTLQALCQRARDGAAQSHSGLMSSMTDAARHKLLERGKSSMKVLVIRLTAIERLV
jgi:hypothetical protein